MKITYYGHSCFSVILGNKHLLFDPFITGNEMASAVDIKQIKADYIFVSHGHFDHMLDAAAIAKSTGAQIIASWELYEHFNSQGLTNLQPLNPGGKALFDFGTVKAFPAQHSSSFTDGQYAGTASGFAIKSPEGSFYYSGDTALTLDMTLVARFADLDLAVLPIGDVLTMGIEDAIEAAKFVKATKVFGVHYDTFGFIAIDKIEALSAFQKSGIELYLPEIGETFEILN